MCTSLVHFVPGRDGCSLVSVHPKGSWKDIAVGVYRVWLTSIWDLY